MCVTAGDSEQLTDNQLEEQQTFLIQELGHGNEKLIVEQNMEIPNYGNTKLWKSRKVYYREDLGF